MVRSKRTKMQSPGRILEYLAFEGRRTAVALGLIAVMAIMWVRVLTGHKPDAAAAAAAATQQGTSRPEPPARVRFRELPRLPGRNDSIYRDFFAVQDRACFRPNAAARGTSAEPEVLVISPNHAQEVIKRVAQRLTLEAVLWSEDSQRVPQAFINDHLLRVGDKLTVKDGTDSIEFEVLRIYEDSVLVGCDGTQLTLKLAQYLEVSK